MFLCYRPSDPTHPFHTPPYYHTFPHLIRRHLHENSCTWLQCTWNLKLRDFPEHLCFYFCLFFFKFIQNARHDEAWMVLRRVHDTNWKAKGEPERVFTVSLYLQWCIVPLADLGCLQGQIEDTFDATHFIYRKDTLLHPLVGLVRGNFIMSQVWCPCKKIDIDICMTCPQIKSTSVVNNISKIQWSCCCACWLSKQFSGLQPSFDYTCISVTKDVMIYLTHNAIQSTILGLGNNFLTKWYW